MTNLQQFAEFSPVARVVQEDRKLHGKVIYFVVVIV